MTRDSSKRGSSHAARSFYPWIARLVGSLAALTIAAPAFAVSVQQQAWGNSPAGDPVTLYTLHDGKAELQVTNYGARIVSLRVPDRTGRLANVVLTEASAAAYSGPAGAVMGATIGRYANRIAGGQIELAGVVSTLARNNGGNTLHGGPAGFNTKLWTAHPVRDGVEMTLTSPDGDMGFPGELTAHVTFRLREDKDGQARVSILYEATTSKPTVVNFTNHTFFNLSGDPDTPVLDDVATIQADSYTAAKSGLPLGTLDPVVGTPFDFRTPRALGAALPERGYDNNFVLRAPGLAHLAARVDDRSSGRTVEVYTTEPGMQLFVPHVVPPDPSAPAPATPRFPALQAFCLETQHFPDSPHHSNFPSTTLRPGQHFRSETVYVFSVDRNGAAQAKGAL